MKRMIYCMAMLLLATACRKEQQIEEPSLEVSAVSQTIKKGETVRFNLTGNADFVKFYPGTPLNDYAFKDGRIIKAGKVKLSFDSYTFSGTQPEQLFAVVSSNFSGIYDIASIRAAQWHDITDRYTLTSLENTWEPAGSSDITDKIEAGKPFYIAYKYVTKPRTEAGVGKIWKIRNLFLTSETEIVNTTLTNLQNGGWQVVYDENGVVDITRNFAVSTALSFRSNASPNDNVYHEVWIISKAFKVADEDLGPDLGASVKSFTEPWLNTYDQKYDKEGDYVATFVGANNSVYGKKEVVKQVKITVQP